MRLMTNAALWMSAVLALGPYSALGATLVVYPDGSGTYPTIRAAVAAANNGDVIELGDGVFSGADNREIRYLRKAITIRSASGVPASCVIDCQGQARGFLFDQDEGADSVLEGVTIRNGVAPTNTLGEGFGGGVACATTYANPGAVPTIRNCWFESNHAATGGGGLYTSGDEAVIEGCVFVDNSADHGGGANIVAGGALFRGCTFVGNSSAHGAAIGLGYAGTWGSDVTIENTIMAFATQGAAMWAGSGSSVTITCSDVFGNPGGDWVDCLLGKNGQNGNISLDPLFCGASHGLGEGSPCAPEQSTCGLIGALPVGCSQGVVIHVCPDGSEAYTTIRAAVDSAHTGDVIELCDGVYTGAGNRDIRFLGKAITIRSTSGNPAACVIDCEHLGRGFLFDEDEGPDSVLEGVTIRHGEAPDNTLGEFFGGGVACATTYANPGAVPTIRNCWFESNHAATGGGGLYTSGDEAVIEGCVFVDNSADHGGGANIVAGGALFRGCTFVGNSSAHGAAIGLGYAGTWGSDVTIENTIMAFATQGAAMWAGSGSSVTITCSDVFGNPGGDWVDCLLGKNGQNGNISRDPQLCTASYDLAESSPCLPEQSGCGLIGARPSGCQATSVTGSVAGVVSVGGAPLANVTVDLAADEGQFVEFATTDAEGEFSFAEVPAGTASISIVVPIGYLAATPANATVDVVVTSGQVVTQNFALQTLPDAGPVREVNYWKHQARVHLTGRGQAEETIEAMSVTYPTLFLEHFFENHLSSISVEGVTFLMAEGQPVRMSLEAIEATLTPGGGATMHERAKKQFLALLLNVASNRLRSTDVVSLDGARASQAIQQIARQINDAIVDNDEDARNLARRLNSERRVPAGMIDLTLPVIPFSRHPVQSPAMDRLPRAVPNPLAKTSTIEFEVSKPGSVVVRVYDIAGRRVRTLIDGVLVQGRHAVAWNGTADDGANAANGIYFCCVETPGQVVTSKIVVMRQ